MLRPTPKIIKVDYRNNSSFITVHPEAGPSLVVTRSPYPLTQIFVARGKGLRRRRPSVGCNIVSFDDDVSSFHVAIVPAAEIDVPFVDGGGAVKRSYARRRPLRPNSGRRGHRIVTIEIPAAEYEEAAVASDDAVKGVLIVIVPQVRQRSPGIVDRVEPIKDVRNVRNFHD